MWNRRLGRTADHRVALLKNMATDLILKGKIETTEMKAKELRSVVDHLITTAKKGDLAARRNAAAYLRNVTTKDGKTAVQVLFDEVAPKYKDRNGGYTRVTKTGFRRGDAAPMATIELV
ncbi:MAG: 50S ribosomal protein L17 [Oscillospiraceae bacterium]|nr:50S ribosomal protein L17 [Erysipelotrichaceae bacterium]MBQ6149252.1 50S ribosomal protein L17 [Oscillospiraceae bacterium]MBQ6494176.1 50S ribosomal protein L17 [Erysipelotrichaceae bacterium]